MSDQPTERTIEDAIAENEGTSPLAEDSTYAENPDSEHGVIQTRGKPGAGGDSKAKASSKTKASS